MADEKDQGVEEKEEQSSEKENSEESKYAQSQETKEEYTLEQLAPLVKGLQKGYTQTRQDMSEIRETLQGMADKANEKSGAKDGEDEYLTVGKLRGILQEEFQQQSSRQENQRNEAQKYLEGQISDLRAQGVITSKKEEDELIQYALDKKEPDLLKAADRWQEEKQAREEGEKNSVKTKARQEEGSKIGTSSKTNTEEQGGIDYEKVRKMDWFSF